MFQPASSSSKLILLLSVLAVPSYAAAWSVQEIGAKVQEIGEKVFSPENLHEYRFELLGLMCLAFYAMMYARGSAAIRKKARTWVRCDDICMMLVWLLCKVAAAEVDRQWQ